MLTDYLLFIHGVNTRESASDPTYADQLFDLIQSRPSGERRGFNCKKLPSVGASIVEALLDFHDL